MVCIFRNEHNKPSCWADFELKNDLIRLHHISFPCQPLTSLIKNTLRCHLSRLLCHIFFSYFFCHNQGVLLAAAGTWVEWQFQTVSSVGFDLQQILTFRESNQPPRICSMPYVGIYRSFVWRSSRLQTKMKVNNIGRRRRRRRRKKIRNSSVRTVRSNVNFFRFLFRSFVATRGAKRFAHPAHHPSRRAPCDSAFAIVYSVLCVFRCLFQCVLVLSRR